MKHRLNTPNERVWCTTQQRCQETCQCQAVCQGKSPCLEAVCQGKSPCLDIRPLSPVEKHLIICKETSIYYILLFGCCVLYHGEPVENIWNSPFHGRLMSLINVSMRTLCTVLLPAPCACAAAVRSSIAIFTTAADLNAVCFFCKKKNKTKKLLFSALNGIFINMVRCSSKSGDFSILSPVFLLSRHCLDAVFCCQGCLSRHCLDAVCQGVKVLSPDIFCHAASKSLV